MNIVFKKSEIHEKRWNERFWFSSQLQPRQKQLVTAFFGEGEVFGGENFAHPGDKNYYCIEYVEQGNATLIDGDKIRYALSPCSLYILYPECNCQISVPPGQVFRKIMIGIVNGALLQTMLYRSQLGSGEILNLKSDTDTIQQFLKIGGMIKNGSVSEEDLSVECYRFLLKLANAQRTKTRISLQPICEYMQNHLHKPITLDDIAVMAGMSKTTLNRKFKEQFGCTPIQYLISLRLDYARTLLQLQHMSVNEAASLCGYRNVKFFSREYHRHFNFPPSHKNISSDSVSRRKGEYSEKKAGRTLKR